MISSSQCDVDDVNALIAGLVEGYDPPTSVFVKFVGVFWIFSSRMTQMGGDVFLSHVVFLVFMIIVLMSRCHCRWSMTVMMIVVMLMLTTLFSPVLEP